MFRVFSLKRNKNKHIESSQSKQKDKFQEIIEESINKSKILHNKLTKLQELVSANIDIASIEKEFEYLLQLIVIHKFKKLLNKKSFEIIKTELYNNEKLKNRIIDIIITHVNIRMSDTSLSFMFESIENILQKLRTDGLIDEITVKEFIQEFKEEIYDIKDIVINNNEAKIGELDIHDDQIIKNFQKLFRIIRLKRGFSNIWEKSKSLESSFEIVEKIKNNELEKLGVSDTTLTIINKMLRDVLKGEDPKLIDDKIVIRYLVFAKNLCVEIVKIIEMIIGEIEALEQNEIFTMLDKDIIVPQLTKIKEEEMPEIISNIDELQKIIIEGEK